MAESKGLSVSPTDEHDATGRDEPAETGATTAGSAIPAPEEERPEEPGEPIPPAAVGEPQDAGEPEEPRGPRTYRMRRAPRYRAFGLTGVVIGVVLGAVLALSFQATGDYSTRTILGYFIAIFGLLGALLGGGVAVLLERRKP